MTRDYDGIILGAGHNGLVLQAYLGKAGLRTLAVERRPVAGGGLSTLEDPRHPGFLHNTHAFFQRAITTMPWYLDLELERHGVRFIEPELNVALLTGDGRVLEWWTDIERTIESFARFSRQRPSTTAASDESIVTSMSEKLSVPIFARSEYLIRYRSRTVSQPRLTSSSETNTVDADCA